jgi:hypothetical protein
MPKVEAIKKKYAELASSPSYKSIDLETLKIGFDDPKITKLAENDSYSWNQGYFLNDIQHGENPERTYLKDLESMLDKYEKQRNSQGLGDSVNMNDMRKIKYTLNSEYNVAQKHWFDDVKRGTFEPPEIEHLNLKNFEIDEVDEIKGHYY